MSQHLPPKERAPSGKLQPEGKAEYRGTRTELDRLDVGVIES